LGLHPWATTLKATTFSVGPWEPAFPYILYVQCRVLIWYSYRGNLTYTLLLPRLWRFFEGCLFPCLKNGMWIGAQISCPKTLNPKGVTPHVLYKRPYIFSSKDYLSGSRSEIFWVVKTCHFAIKKCPWQHGEENFLKKNSKKFLTFGGRRLWNGQDFWRIWADCFFWNHHI
jgi:hypothetical protein